MSTKINSRPMFDDSACLNGLFIGWVVLTTFMALLMFSKFERDLAQRAEQEEIILNSECEVVRQVNDLENEYACNDGTMKIRRAI